MVFKEDSFEFKVAILRGPDFITEGKDLEK